MSFSYAGRPNWNEPQECEPDGYGRKVYITHCRGEAVHMFGTFSLPSFELLPPHKQLPFFFVFLTVRWANYEDPGHQTTADG